MRFKLDENFSPRIKQLFTEQGHDCMNVRDEGLFGAPDADVLQAAVREQRVLVTMDHDFGNVLLYPPQQASGILIIHPPGKASLGLLQSLIRQSLTVLEREPIRGRLWIVEPGRIREHEPEELPGWEELE